MNIHPVHIEVEGIKYVPENQTNGGEVLTISEVRPVYRMWKDGYEQESLVLAFTEMPRTKFRPGMKVRVIVER